MDKIQSNTWIVATPNQVSTSVSGETIILNTKTDRYHGLNAVGARVWEILTKPTTFGTIVDTLISEYDIDTETCEHDLSELLRQLGDAGLVEIGD